MTSEGKLLISVGGDIWYDRFIRNVFSEEFTFCDLNSSTNQDIIYWIQGRGPELFRNPRIWIAKKPMLIIHWVGTDVLREMNRKPRTIKGKVYWKLWDILFKRKHGLGGILNLAGAPWLVEELSTCGIKAHCLPISTLNIDDMPKVDDSLEREIDFLSYLPYNSFDFYGGNTIIRIAERMKGYNFTIVQPDILKTEESNFSECSSNVTVIPKVDFSEMQKVYSKAKCFLRFTKHDGLSLSVLESLYFKMQVFWTNKFPYVHHVTTDDIGNLQQRMVDAVVMWEPNNRGHEFVMEEYSVSRCAEQLRHILRSS
ncbi:hypothetical protein ACFL60_01925 [Candidatus Omnitrophota bacterium]